MDLLKIFDKKDIMKKAFIYLSILATFFFSACELEQDTDNLDTGYPYVDYEFENYMAPPILTADIDGNHVVVCDTYPPYNGSYESIGGFMSEYSGYYQNTGSWNWQVYGTSVSNQNDSRRFTLSTGIISFPFQSFGSNYLTYTDFINYFKTGLNDYQYSSTAISPYNGTNLDTYQVSLVYRDENGVQWNSYGGSQTGSNFQITDTIRYKYYYGSSDAKIKYKARFNCKLYNSTGQSKTLTNGLFIGEFWLDIP